MSVIFFSRNEKNERGKKEAIRSVWEKHNLFGIPSHLYARVRVVKVTFLGNNHASERGAQVVALARNEDLRVFEKIMPERFYDVI